MRPRYALYFILILAAAILGFLAARRMWGSAAMESPAPTPTVSLFSEVEVVSPTATPTPRPEATATIPPDIPVQRIEDFLPEFPSDGTEALHPSEFKKIVEGNKLYVIPVRLELPKAEKLPYIELQDRSGMPYAAFIRWERKMLDSNNRIHMPSVFTRVLSATVQGDRVVIYGLEGVNYYYANCKVYQVGIEYGGLTMKHYFGVTMVPSQEGNIRCATFRSVPAERGDLTMWDGLELPDRLLALYAHYDDGYKMELVEFGLDGKEIRSRPFAIRFNRWVFVTPEGAICVPMETEKLGCFTPENKDPEKPDFLIPDMQPVPAERIAERASQLVDLPERPLP